MKRWCLLLGLLVSLAGPAAAADEYPLGPDSQRQTAVPKGTVTKYSWISKVFPGTVRDYWIYVPAQYAPEKPACVMVFQDGKMFVNEEGRARIPIVFDNLIARHDMPVTIAILIDPGVLKAPRAGQQDRINRSYEYDGMSGRYATFLLNEILPEVARHYNLSTNPNDRAISGLSSGGICAFTVAWTHPEAFRRVLSFIGSYTDLRGGDVYPALIRKTEPKPLRVFLQDGNHDLNNFAGDWWLANQSMASALTFAGYDVKFVTGDKDHDMIQGGAILPDALRWLWRDYPTPITKAAMKAPGDPNTGFPGVDSDWEEVLGISAISGSKEPESLLLLNDQLKDARGIAVDPRGDVYTGVLSGDPIYRIGADGHVEIFAKANRSVRSLAVGPDATLYGCTDDGIISFSADGKVIVRLKGIRCQDLVVTHEGEFVFTGDGGVVSLVPGNLHEAKHYRPLNYRGRRSFVANGICLSNDGSMIYVSDPNARWIWGYQAEPEGILANEEPFFRLETLDEASASGSAGMATDSKGLLYVATFLGIQICDQQGRVVAVLNLPEQAGASSPVSGLAFGGHDRQELYAVAGNKVFRRHVARRDGQ